MKENNYCKTQISVLVLTYNSALKDIELTLKSILEQEGVCFQIIVGDDGSKIDYFYEIKMLFDKYEFDNYKLIKNSSNNGTCMNYFNAVIAAEGDYIKPLSPKDFFYSKKSLYNLYCYVKKNKAEIVFSKAIYYSCGDNQEAAILKLKSTQPSLSYLYRVETYNDKGTKITNLVLCDNILGASYFCKKELLMKYLPEIIGKVRLCEDFAYRLMLLDDIKIFYYDTPTIYYDYGSGVSHMHKSDGSPLLRNDEIAFDNILISRSCKTKFQTKIRNYTKKKRNNRVFNRLISFVYFPSSLFYRLKKAAYTNAGRAQTTVECDDAFLQELGVKLYCKS